MRRVSLFGVALVLIAMAGTAVAADTNTMTVSASVTGVCKFASATSTLNFGSLDPSVGTDVTPAPTLINFWCTKGVTTDAITVGGSATSPLNGRSMGGPAGDSIPYSLSWSPPAGANNGPGSPRTLSIAGTVLGTDYTGKSAGSYSDTVTISITP